MKLKCLVAAFALLPLASIADDAPKLKYTVSWLGNSFSGKDAWVLQDVEDLCVMPDGTLFTNVFWDEAGGNGQEYKAGDLVSVAGHTHGWGYQGGSAVAANSKYLFLAQTVDSEGGGLKGDSWPPKGFTWSGVSRRKRPDTKLAAPFTGGRGKEGDVLQKAFLPITEFPEKVPGAIRGLCADEKQLYVSSPFDNSIKIYDADTMALLRSWSVMRPDKLTVDNTGHIWVLQKPASEAEGWQALCYSQIGDLFKQNIQFPVGMLPTDLCVDRMNRLVVADGGPDNQVKVYDGLDKTPRLVGFLGEKGGIFAKPTGQVGEMRFNKPVGVGTDSAGNMYVASGGTTAGGSTVLESYSPTGRLLWRRMGLLFVDCPGAKPKAPEHVYTKEEHFFLDYSRPPGKEWSYLGYTVNPAKYPNDPRLHLGATNSFMRELGGRDFLFVTDMTGEFLAVYRFFPQADGETAIPCALFAKKHLDKDNYPPNQPAKGEWVWIDANGNGAMDEGEFKSNDGSESEGIPVVDSQGTVWQANGKSIRALLTTEFNSYGVPLWDYSKAKTYPKPDDFDQVRRMRYLPESDTMILGGNKGEDHNQHWKPMGPVLSIYTDWKSGQPKLKKKVVLPLEKGSEGHESVEPMSFDVAGDYLFVAYTRGLKADGIKNAFVKILKLDDLSVVGNLSAESALGETGLLDLVESVSATKRPNGEYVVFMEDDFKSKSVVFRWDPNVNEAKK